MSHFASDTTAQSSGSQRYRASIPADPEFGLLDRLADHLAPLFVTNRDDLPVARIMAGRTIAGYQPQTSGDYINIARTISFSLSALAMLSRVAAEDMTTDLRLRFLGRATALNRAADESERAMDRRRRYHACLRRAGERSPAGECAEPAADDRRRDEAAIQAAVDEAVREYCAMQRGSAPDGEPREPLPAAASLDTGETDHVAADQEVAVGFGQDLPAAAQPLAADASIADRIVTTTDGPSQGRLVRPDADAVRDDRRPSAVQQPDQDPAGDAAEGSVGYGTGRTGDLIGRR